MPFNPFQDSFGKFLSNISKMVKAEQASQSTNSSTAQNIKEKEKKRDRAAMDIAISSTEAQNVEEQPPQKKKLKVEEGQASNVPTPVAANYLEESPVSSKSSPRDVPLNEHPEMKGSHNEV
eukprot:TRINITY_DN1996_c0_g2_i1.p1 TRINITY_DN1996_c0_g2~~TRINITY_DN1996_c0_g2_i1.p1  ORF type:complete len:121 (-),score=25.87 TRINITY_DN1996_c0_g2_i1:101-463(-)